VINRTHIGKSNIQIPPQQLPGPVHSVTYLGSVLDPYSYRLASPVSERFGIVKAELTDTAKSWPTMTSGSQHTLTFMGDHALGVARTFGAQSACRQLAVPKKLGAAIAAPSCNL